MLINAQDNVNLQDVLYLGLTMQRTEFDYDWNPEPIGLSLPTDMETETSINSIWNTLSIW